MTTTPTDILKRVSNLAPGDKSDDVYNDWSATYDDHLLEEFGYVSPRVCAEVFAEALSDRTPPIIDYGCGTGLVGAALAEQGFSCIDGVDLSAGMLQQARAKNIYRKLSNGDLTLPIDLPDDTYAAGACIGSMGAGHVGAEHVAELLRPLQAGGLFVIIMNDQYYLADGFDRQFAAIEEQNLWIIQRREKFNYMDRLERPGWLLVAQKPV